MKCKFCKVEKLRYELDEKCRCQSCRDAFMATHLGTSYGRYMAMMFVPKPPAEPEPPDPRICKYCLCPVTWAGPPINDECCGDPQCRAEHLRRLQIEKSVKSGKAAEYRRTSKARKLDSQY